MTTEEFAGMFRYYFTFIKAKQSINMTVFTGLRHLLAFLTAFPV